jgi:hypothetical protein
MFEEIPSLWKYGYPRVSSKSEQDNSSLESQKQEFLKLGIPEINIRLEVGSAADNIQDRLVFYNLINKELTQKDVF